jgi:hypothetical protein
MSKRNHTTNAAKKSGISPYARYGKTPFLYSSALRQWERENGRRESVEAERVAHSRNVRAAANRRMVHGN